MYTHLKTETENGPPPPPKNWSPLIFKLGPPFLIKDTCKEVRRAYKLPITPPVIAREGQGHWSKPEGYVKDPKLRMCELI